MKTQIAALALFFASVPVVAASESETLLADTVTVVSEPIVKLTMPLSLTAHDFITKVYGFIDSGCTKDQVVEASRRVAAIVPEEDEFGLWLSGDNGYSVSYYGMKPEVEAMVQYEKDRVSNYGFFFLFPYGQGEREKANSRQSEFCGALLQELYDIGLSIGQPHVTDAVFEAIGDYMGNYVDIRLLEEVFAPDGVVYNYRLSAQIEAASAKDSKGRFIVILNVEPRGFTEADDMAAN